MKIKSSIGPLSLLALSVTTLTACQSWSPAGTPLNNPARVPPPGTGTYQVPSAYYNNSGGNLSQVYSGSDPVAMQQAMPAAGFAAAADGGLPASNVQPAAYAVPTNSNIGQAGQGYSSPGMNNPAVPSTQFSDRSVESGSDFSSAAGSGPSTSFSDSVDAPPLQWQH